MNEICICTGPRRGRAAWSWRLGGLVRGGLQMRCDAMQGDAMRTRLQRNGAADKQHQRAKVDAALMRPAEDGCQAI